MGLVRREDRDHGVVRLSLCNGGGNALSPALLEELGGALRELEAAPPRALLLDGGEAKLFSGGFDLPTIHAWDRPRMRGFMKGFTEALASVLRLQAPTVVAIHSHALAGGFILSLAFDLRVVERRQRLKLGLNEVDLGVAVPAGTQVLLAARTSPQLALRLSTCGQLFGAEEAERFGYADELVDDARARGLELATALARKPGAGAAVTPTFSNPGLLARMEAADQAHFETFLDTWFGDVAQGALRQVVARLTGGK